MMRKLVCLQLAAIVIAAGCSSDDKSPAVDSAVTDGAVGGDAAADSTGADSTRTDSASADGGISDGALPADAGPDAVGQFAESEPNNGSSVSEVNTISGWSVVSGAIGTADDADVFAFDVSAGDRLKIEVDASGGPLQPHVAVFGGPGFDVPAAVNAGAGPKVLVEYYVLESGTLLVAVQDRRNVGGSSAGVGDASFGYVLTTAPLTRAPLSASIGSTVAGNLSPAGTVRVYQLATQQGDDLEIAVIAKGLSSPSQVDSRLSLFHPAQKAWAGTNDNPDLSQTDSLLQGPMPLGGTYHLIVENVELGASDLRFELKVTKRN